LGRPVFSPPEVQAPCCIANCPGRNHASRPVLVLGPRPPSQPSGLGVHGPLEQLPPHSCSQWQPSRNPSRSFTGGRHRMVRPGAPLRRVGAVERRAAYCRGRITVAIRPGRRMVRPGAGTLSQTTLRRWAAGTPQAKTRYVAAMPKLPAEAWRGPVRRFATDLRAGSRSSRMAVGR
jgi:hypothetical protein